ncbi:MAG TPA: hypothetical protein V6D14_10055 [Coleofasciculaceae cyanobacterium]|jgi:hypothetical protein
MKRLYTTKRTLCPICSNHHGCAIREDDLIECLRSTSQHDAPRGYRFIKLLRNGMGGLFALSSDQRLEPHQNQIERQQQKKKAAVERAKGALPVAELDRAIRKLHRYFDLGSQHRKDLRDRGLSDAQIETGLFFSVYPDQELPPGIPANLPGVTRRGDKFYTAGSGYVCPSFDLEGRVNGWQIRFDDPERVGAKYKWSREPHLQSGELPIMVARPMGGVTCPGVCLAEGFLKPFVAAQKLGQICIGSPNGQFSNSPEQTLAALQAYCIDRKVTLAPDAGDACNSQVMQRWNSQIKWLQSQGYVVNIGWWGQIDKSHPDVDELNGTQVMATITPEEFFALGGQPTPSPAQTLDIGHPITCDEWELKFGFGRRLRDRIKQTLERFKGFGKPPAPKPKPKEAPDRTFQEANQRLTTWQDAIAQGYKYILDASPPGGGKSHTAGIALPNAFGVEKLWYLSNDHRNPTTGVIESNYADLPVRHGGLKIDDSRKTPNGNPFLAHPKPGEEPDTRANCHRTPLFRAFAAKGYRNQENAKSSAICSKCKVAHLCQQGIGAKYGATFRGERADALSNDRIRAHADSLPSPHEFIFGTCGLFWDEAGTHLKVMDETRVSLEEFDRTWAELESKAPDLHEQLKPLRLALRPLLTGELKQPYHGWDDASLRALLPEKPDNLSEAIASLEALLQPDLSFLEQKAEFVSAADAKRKKVSKGMQALVNEEFRRQANQEFQEAFDRLPLNWLVPFLKVWDGEKGAFRSEWQQLIVFVKSERHAAIARAAKFNIFLDATIDRERLALRLGIDPSEIYVIAQETPNRGNLKIRQITGMGKLGKERSDSLKDRIAALRKALEEGYPGIVFGDWKGQAKEGDGQWFVNLRGSNEFQNAPAMAVFGIPYQNVGYLQALYQTLTGEFAPLDKEKPHEGLQQFIEAHTQAEIEQAVGRLRAHLRPNEELTFIFIGDYDLSFLGCEIEQVEAFEIAREAGTAAQVTRWKILQAVRQLREQRQKLTQDAIASLAGISQALIAKIAKPFGGWKGLLKLLLLLLDCLYSKSNNFESAFEGLTDEQKHLARTYLPLALDEPPEQAVELIVETVQAYGLGAFLRIVAAATPQTQARLVALVMQALPANFQSELVALLEGIP